jgi:hypothetical protein
MTTEKRNFYFQNKINTYCIRYENIGFIGECLNAKIEISSIIGVRNQEPKKIGVIFLDRHKEILSSFDCSKINGSCFSQGLLVKSIILVTILI